MAIEDNRPGLRVSVELGRVRAEAGAASGAHAATRKAAQPSSS